MSLRILYWTLLSSIQVDSNPRSTSGIIPILLDILLMVPQVSNKLDLLMPQHMPSKVLKPNLLSQTKGSKVPRNLEQGQPQARLHA